MKEIINKYKEKINKFDIENRIYYVRMLRMVIIVSQILQRLISIRIIPVMLSGFFIAALSVIDIILVEEAYKTKKITKRNRYTMQFVNIIIILIIWKA